MSQYFVQRLLLVIPTIVGVSIVVFGAVRFLPGDVVDQIAGEYGASSAEHRAALERQYSLDENVFQQYFEWVGKVARGDFGVSIFSGRPVTHDMKTRLPATIEIGFLALVISVLLALPVGILSAVWQDSWADAVARALAVALLAVPSFWLGLLVLTYGFTIFGWTPPLEFTQFWEDPLKNLQTLWAPALVLGSSLSGAVMRLTRSAMLDVLRQDYMRTAHAKGLRSSNVVLGHGLRNAVLPVITVVGLQVPIVIGGTVVIESVFSIPGMGSYLLSAVQTRDYPVVQAIVLLSASAVIVSNLVVDCLYPVFDPRLRSAS